MQIILVYTMCIMAACDYWSDWELVFLPFRQHVSGALPSVQLEREESATFHFSWKDWFLYHPKAKLLPT